MQKHAGCYCLHSPILRGIQEELLKRGNSLSQTTKDLSAWRQAGYACGSQCMTEESATHPHVQWGVG